MSNKSLQNIKLKTESNMEKDFSTHNDELMADRLSVGCLTDPQFKIRNYEISKIFTKEMDLHKQLQQKSKEIEQQQNIIANALHDRKQQLETQGGIVKKAIEDIIDEISTLDGEIIKVKKLLLTLRVPEGIVNECLNRRASRPGTELVDDDVKKQLKKLLMQVTDFRHDLDEIVEQLENQQKENKNSQQRLEYDWNNKAHAIKIDERNIALNDNPSVAMHKGHVTHMSSWLPSLQTWCSSSKEVLEFCENTRKNSMKLRSTLDNTLMKIAKDLRLSANILEQTFQTQIDTDYRIEKCFTGELVSILSSLVSAEERCDNLKKSMNNLNQTSKLSETHLDNRKSRPDIENVNDLPQQSLVKEEKLIQKTQELMKITLIETENLINELNKTRGILERKINVKRQSIIFDGELLLLLKAHFPTENELLGITTV